ncbi:hypothetical protein WJX75_005784 [Coccomyxa subellipsoidea]|uniref:BZIP domain-containing protein n=1 Tax=Coccomyxa subellipsoidea TaxID=248742 RepID=A0ABR2YFI1_9CHLO
MVGRDSQLSATQLPTTSDALSFRDFLPIYNGSASEQPSPQEPTFDPGLHYEDHNNDNHASQKRSGSDTTTKRQKAHQEKSKRAQKRYRERKKALHEDQQKQIEELTAQLQEAQINKSRLETRCQLLEKVVSIRGGGGDVAGSSARAPQAVPEYVTATAALLGLIYPGHGVETSLRTDHVERMTFQDYIKVMSDFKQRLLRLMLNTDGREGCPVRREIEKLIETRRWSTHTILEHNPARMMRIAVEVRSQKLHNTENAYDLDKQHRVLAAMELTPEQKARIVENRRRLLIGLEELIRRQNVAVEVLQDNMPLQYNDMSASMAFLKATLAAQDISEGLKQNHGAVRDFMTELLGGVLTLWQEAKCMVEAWPGYPDALAISNMLAEELGDETANARLLLLKPGPGAGDIKKNETLRQPLLLQSIASTSDAT